VTPARRFPFGHAPRTPRVESAPVPERLTMPMDHAALRRPVLPFVHANSSPDLPHRDREGADALWRGGHQALASETPGRAMPPASDGRRRLRLAVFALGLLLYAGVLLAIVAPDAWWP